MAKIKNPLTVVQSGGVKQIENGVEFYDYDATLIEAWDSSEVAGKTSLPPNPAHDGLTAMGWNWALQEIQDYFEEYPDHFIQVGQEYKTTDEKTRLHITLPEDSFTVTLNMGVGKAINVDWGDGITAPLTPTTIGDIRAFSHTYQSRGDYVISIDGSDGLWLYANFLSQNTNVKNKGILRKAFLGKTGESLGTESNGAFKECINLEYVTRGENRYYGGYNAFLGSGIKIMVQRRESMGASTVDCRKLQVVAFAATGGGSYGLRNAPIKRYSIRAEKTSTGILSFAGSTIQKIDFVDTITEISSESFENCKSLRNVKLPDAVTTIGSYAFLGCISLTEMEIPAAVTTIGAYAFTDLSNLGFLRFKGSTPPTVANVNAWRNLPTDCTIYIPAGSLSAYTAATNYPDPTIYTYVEE